MWRWDYIALNLPISMPTSSVLIRSPFASRLQPIICQILSPLSTNPKTTNGIITKRPATSTSHCLS